MDRRVWARLKTTMSDQVITATSLVPRDAQIFNSWIILSSLGYVSVIMIMFFSSLAPFMDEHTNSIAVWTFMAIFLFLMIVSTFWLISENINSPGKNFSSTMSRVRFVYIVAMLGDVFAILFGACVLADLRGKIDPDSNFDISTVSGSLYGCGISIILIAVVRLLLPIIYMILSKEFRDYIFGLNQKITVGLYPTKGVPNNTTRWNAPLVPIV